VAAGDLDGDGRDEIITGPGPGRIFGPNVRAFRYHPDADPPGVTPLPGVNYFAYGTSRWGVNVAAGDADGDGFDEIITGPGSGVVFSSHVRGWQVDGGQAEAMRDINFFAYPNLKFGCVVSGGNTDGDIFDEILTAPGPSPAYPAHIKSWDFDGMAITPVPNGAFFAWPSGETRYGARIFAGHDFQTDGQDDIVVGAGPDPSTEGRIRVFRYNGVETTLWFSLQAFDSQYGANVAAGRFMSLP